MRLCVALALLLGCASPFPTPLTARPQDVGIPASGDLWVSNPYRFPVVVTVDGREVRSLAHGESATFSSPRGRHYIALCSDPSRGLSAPECYAFWIEDVP